MRKINSPKSKSKDRTWAKVHAPNVLYARKDRRQPSSHRWEMEIQRSSKEGHRADALALGADERRDKLR